MRRLGPALAVAVVLLANALALVGVARNRAGEPEAEVRLTERELPLAPWTDESTGVFLRLEWQRSLPGSKADWPWFDRAKLESLGFDCRHPVDAKDAREHYGRVVARRAYVVLEHDGPAWGPWLEAREAQPREMKPPPENARVLASRLVPIDVGLDPAALRRLHPDRSRCLVVPAIVAPRWTPLEASAEEGSGRAVLSGRIRNLLVPEVHVPRDRAASLGGLRAAAPAAPPRYEVLLRLGAHLEPWVAEVRPLP